MKKSLIFLLLACIAFKIKAQEPVYEVKSAKIVYRCETAGIITDYILIFTDNGKRVAMEFNMMVDGVLEKSRTISTPEFMYLINYSQKQATKIPLDMVDNQGIENEDGQLDISKVAMEIKNNGAVKIGTETVASKACDVYEFTDQNGNKAKYWLWKGMLMKGDFIEEGYHSFIEIKEITTDIVIDDKEFEIPGDFEVTDMSDAMKQMQQMQQKYGTPGEDE